VLATVTRNRSWSVVLIVLRFERAPLHTGPAIALTTALMTSAVIPWAIGFIFSARISYYRQRRLLYFILLPVVNRCVRNYDCWWASNNKFSLIGAVRRFSNDLVRGAAMGLSIIDDDRNLKFTREISAQQSGMNWNVFLQPVYVPDIF
jgi:NADH-quinone oxidoreductase subunit H